jgi:hypothetical protein
MLAVGGCLFFGGGMRVRLARLGLSVVLLSTTTVVVAALGVSSASAGIDSNRSSVCKTLKALGNNNSLSKEISLEQGAANKASGNLKKNLNTLVAIEKKAALAGKVTSSQKAAALSLEKKIVPEVTAYCS